MRATVKKAATARSVEWEGRTYLPGETIPDLAAKEAERLYRLGLIEPAAKGEKASGKDDDKGSGGKGADKGKDPEKDKDPEGKGPEAPDGGGAG